MKRIIVIDGNDFNDMLIFYDEVKRVLIKDLNFSIGCNQDTFNDVLGGDLVFKMINQF